MAQEFRSAEERRAAVVALTQKETDIDEKMIETLIRGFYARVRQDALLAPIFELRISEWEPHLGNMFAFWSSLTLQTGRYHGRPMAKHMPLAVDARHFDRWLALFEEAARDLCPPAARNGSSSARVGSRKASSSASRARTESFGQRRALPTASVKDSLVGKEGEQTLPLSPITHTSVCGFVVFVAPRGVANHHSPDRDIFDRRVGLDDLRAVEIDQHVLDLRILLLEREQTARLARVGFRGQVFPRKPRSRSAGPPSPTGS